MPSVTAQLAGFLPPCLGAEEGRLLEGGGGSASSEFPQRAETLCGPRTHTGQETREGTENQLWEGVCELLAAAVANRVASDKVHITPTPASIITGLHLFGCPSVAFQ